MKKIKIYLPGVIAALLLSMSAHAATEVTFVSDSLYYKSSDGLLFTIDEDNSTATIVENQYQKPDTIGTVYRRRTSVDIPDSISYNGTVYPVTTIGRGCFAYCWQLKTVTIPKTVKTMKRSCFYDDTLLVKVTFAEGSLLEELDSECFCRCPMLDTINLEECSVLTTIGTGCFLNDSALTNITIPAGVENIKRAAWYGCVALENVTFKEGSRLTIIDEYAFAKTGLTAINMPEGVESIGDWAFCYSKLTKVDIPDSVSQIGIGAFYDIDELKSVTFADDCQVESLDSACFAYCSALDTINLEVCSKLTTIGKHCFRRDSALTSVTIPAGVESIKHGAWYDCVSLENVTFEENSRLAAISDYTFGKTALTAIDIPDGVESIGYGAFTRCPLTKVDIPAKVAQLGTGAFYMNDKLQSVTFADESQVESLDSACFAYCSALDTINLEVCSELTTIGMDCFREDSALTNITIPAGVTALSSFAMYSCGGLKRVAFEEGSRLKAIGEYAFSKASVAEIDIPDSVESIGYGAFSRCRMTTLDIPSSVTTIGDRCFNACDNMRSITLHPEALESYGSRAFSSCSDSLVIYVPPYSLTAYRSAWTDNVDQIRPFYELTIAEDIGAATLCLPFEAVIPDGLQLYTLNALNADSTKVCGDEVTDTLTRDTPVYVSAPDDAATYVFRGTSSDDVTDDSNTPVVDWLTGVYKKTQVPAGSFVLQNLEANGVSFYPVSENSTIYVNAFRAYLTVGDEVAEAITNLVFGTDDDSDNDTSAITHLTGSTATTVAGNAVYNLHGMRVDADRLTKGIYVIGGKKVIIR